jgi:hypothetical protein
MTTKGPEEEGREEEGRWMRRGGWEGEEVTKKIRLPLALFYEVSPPALQK